MSADHAWTADAIARDLDLVVFELEQAPRKGDDRDALLAERQELRRKLERLRQRVEDLASALG
ncbi:MAG: hypothetical protein H6732_01440 [Alphaproteobacteria bacterium]|nr:hypothetical protein [Alphaproteobacteria bacterium]